MKSLCCEFCSEDLNFRVINGITVPLHARESLCVGKSYYRTDNLNRCIPTQCPKCLKAVYFVRHNGGSVWLDGLGWPWPKHECMNTALNTIPEWWHSLAEAGECRLAQIWVYGLLTGESGGAFWISERPRNKKPRLLGAKLRRLMCDSEYRPKLLKLKGSMVIKRKNEVILLDGTILQDDGPYVSSFGWW